MPREIVRGCEPILGTQDSPEVEGLVQVLWHDELDHVQVATTSRVAVSLDVVEQGLYVNLDRRGINDLIRHLRRARNRAFGEDA